MRRLAFPGRSADADAQPVPKSHTISPLEKGARGIDFWDVIPGIANLLIGPYPPSNNPSTHSQTPGE